MSIQLIFKGNLCSCLLFFCAGDTGRCLLIYKSYTVIGEIKKLRAICRSQSNSPWLSLFEKMMNGIGHLY